MTTPSEALLIQGDNRQVLRRLPANSIDGTVTDPPYGLDCFTLSRAWDNVGEPARLQAWATEWAQELLRVHKPGAALLAFGAPRTYHRLAAGIEDAGWEIQDSLHWVYGSGFNKVGYFSYRLERTLCRKDTAGQDVYLDDGVPMQLKPPFRHPEANRLWGLAGALRPAHEPIVLARKPYQKGVLQNVVDFTVGGLDINACRADRWPTNLLLSHTPDCTPVGTRRISGDDRKGYAPGREAGGFADVGRAKARATAPGGQVYPSGWVQTWSCTPECPVAALDQQAGVRTSGSSKGFLGKGAVSPALGDKRACIRPESVYADSGPVSRYYPTFGWEHEAADSLLFPGYYCAKASGKERRAGAEGQNKHPTVKPLALMRWLVRLVIPPAGLVLDPFLGSGSTACAAVLEKRRAIGIELREDYLSLARARVAYWTQRGA